MTTSTKRIAELVQDLPEKEKFAILELIDLKTEHDMDRVLSKFESLENSMKSEMKSLNSKISIVYWLIGGLSLLMSIYKFLG